MSAYLADRTFSYDGKSFLKGDAVPDGVLSALISLGGGFVVEAEPAPSVATKSPRKPKEAQDGNE